MYNIQEDREFCRAPIKARGLKVETIPAILLVVSKRILHDWNEMDRLYLGECSLDVADLGIVGKDLYSPCFMSAPAFPWPFRRLIADVILL
jgi:hypothetical protein